MRYALALLLVAAFCCNAVQAQSLQEIDKRDAAVLDAWNATPLTVRRAIFVDGHPEGFGQYVERANNVFKKGEPLVTYAEPVGYGWKDVGDGVYEFGFKADWQVKSADGKVLGGKEDFADVTKKSRARNREFDVVLSLGLSDITPGDYILEYTLHDIASSKTYTISQSFKVVG